MSTYIPMYCRVVTHLSKQSFAVKAFSEALVIISPPKFFFIEVEINWCVVNSAVYYFQTPWTFKIGHVCKYKPLQVVASCNVRKDCAYACNHLHDYASISVLYCAVIVAQDMPLHKNNIKNGYF